MLLPSPVMMPKQILFLRSSACSNFTKFTYFNSYNLYLHFATLIFFQNLIIFFHRIIVPIPINTRHAFPFNLPVYIAEQISDNFLFSFKAQTILMLFILRSPSSTFLAPFKNNLGRFLNHYFFEIQSVLQSTASSSFIIKVPIYSLLYFVRKPNFL